jgi:NADPH-dependent 2,4-dienoyl-CoA reductase/sulfur reductase-like enzyme
MDVGRPVGTVVPHLCERAARGRNGCTVGSLHEVHPSIWVATCAPSLYPRLQGTVAVDVAIIGGGIAGLAAAVLLGRAGVEVAVVEAGRIASGTTGYTTAKLSALHGLA